MNDHQYTDQEICCIIRDYDQMIQDIRHRIESLARELWDLDSNDDWLCKLLSLQHQETGTITTHTDHHDLSDLLKSKKLKGLQYAKELQEGIEIEMQKWNRSSSYIVATWNFLEGSMNYYVACTRNLCHGMHCRKNTKYQKYIYKKKKKRIKHDT